MTTIRRAVEGFLESAVLYLLFLAEIDQLGLSLLFLADIDQLGPVRYYN